MTVILRCVLIVVSILLTFFVLKKIRQSKVKIEDSIFWVMFALMMVVFSIFPGLADICRNVFHIQFHLYVCDLYPVGEGVLPVS